MANVLSNRNSESDVRAARLRDFLNDCVGSAACEEADRIREAVLLLDGGASPNGQPPDPVVVEAMLACGAAESAVLAILHPDMSFMLSRGAGGSCLATVVVEDGSEEMISEGSTIALALLAAYASLLLSRTEREDAEMNRIMVPPSARFH